MSDVVCHVVHHYCHWYYALMSTNRRNNRLELVDNERRTDNLVFVVRFLMKNSS